MSLDAARKSPCATSDPPRLRVRNAAGFVPLTAAGVPLHHCRGSANAWSAAALVIWKSFQQH
jgi:hypothetical protein